MAPAFAKLRNPVVRRTVAKVATLGAGGQIGGMNLQAMILRLRAAAGVNGPEEPKAPVGNAGDDASYVMAGLVVEKEINADAMLERGVHPIGKIREAVSALKTGACCCEALLCRNRSSRLCDVQEQLSTARLLLESTLLGLEKPSREGVVSLGEFRSRSGRRIDITPGRLRTECRK